MTSDADRVPVVWASWSGYENVEVVCPHCEMVNIFNRITDLGTTKRIGSRDLSCLIPDCGRSFHLVSDSVNDPHALMLFDCERLIARKQYMSCVLTVGQAYEVFFALFLRVELAFRPWAADPDNDVSALNRLLELLQARIEDHTFGKLRAIVVLRAAEMQPPKNVAEAEKAISELSKFGKETFKRFEAIDLGSLPDRKLGDLLKKLRTTSIHDLRNKTVHKQAYRPTLEEARSALDEARDVLPLLRSLLDLHDEPNWYQRRLRSDRGRG